VPTGETGTRGYYSKNAPQEIAANLGRAARGLQRLEDPSERGAFIDRATRSFNR
jgi:hypothetical protein